jgi:YggT family protein
MAPTVLGPHQKPGTAPIVASGRHLRRGSGAVKDDGRKEDCKDADLVPRRSNRYFPPTSEPGTHDMRAILDVILLILQIYIWLLIAAAVLSWLIAFNVVNTRNQVVAMAGDFLYRITEPVLRPIRSILPNLGGIDVSPVILILIIFFIQNVILRYIYPNVF